LHGLPVPGDDRLATLLSLLHESSDKGEIDWSQSSFRLADGMLWLCHGHPCKPDMKCDYSWHPSVPLRLKETASELRAQTCKGEGLSTIKLGNRALRVTCRNGGELCRMPGDHGMKSLKKLFQDLSIPAWRRSCIPLVYLDNELLAIGAYWYNPHFLPAASEDGYIFSVNCCHLQGSDC
jgi:tRNA(Ile)-lysidine synthase